MSTNGVTDASTSELPVLIEAAINGGTTRERNPHVPVTPHEIRADAMRCFDAGATIVHAHNDDIRLTGMDAAARYLEAWAPLLAAHPDVLWCPTLCAPPGADGGARSRVDHPRDARCRRPPRRQRLRELLRRHPRGVHDLRGALVGATAGDLRAGVPAVRAHVPARRAPAGRVDGQ